MGHFRTLGPALLGAFMWLDDPELIQAMANYPSLCVVVSKQPASTSRSRRNQQATFDRLREVCDSGKGFPAEACSELRSLAPRENGKPMIVGPYTITARDRPAGLQVDRATTHRQPPRPDPAHQDGAAR